MPLTKITSAQTLFHVTDFFRGGERQREEMLAQPAGTPTCDDCSGNCLCPIGDNTSSQQTKTKNNSGS